MSYRISLVVLWLTSLAFPNAPGFCEGSQSFAPLEEGQEWARQTASLIATAARSDAEKSWNAPPNRPIGVRHPLTTTTSSMGTTPFS